jgi:membrane associated rhomboid family serine protease
MNGTARRFPPVSLALGAAFIVANIAFSMAPDAQKEAVLYDFAIIPARFEQGSSVGFARWYEAAGPLLGHPFLHLGWLHLGINLLAFIQAAPIVEQRMGAVRMLALFFISAIASAALFIALNHDPRISGVGASGAICGLFAAYFLSVRANWRSALADPQIRNAAMMFLVINVGLAAVARMTGFLPIAWEAHLGGFIGGALAFPLLAPPARRVGPWG